MFLTDDDYRTVIGDDAMKVVSRSAEIRLNAEREAIEEVSGYLRPRYDCNEVFGELDTARNPLIVMYTADIALYHMACSLPGKMGLEIRKERYDRAIKWLEGVQAGKVVPMLALPEQDDSDDAGGILFDSDKRLRHNW